MTRRRTLEVMTSLTHQVYGKHRFPKRGMVRATRTDRPAPLPTLPERWQRYRETCRGR